MKMLPHDQKVISQWMEKGNSDYISKPFDFDTVLKPISDILGK